jgi:hypothetical protein
LGNPQRVRPDAGTGGILTNFFVAPSGAWRLVAPISAAWRSILVGMRVRTRVYVMAATASLAIGSVAGLAFTASSAAAASSDTAATQAYVQAGYQALRVGIAHLATSKAAPLHLVAKVQGECPQIGAQSPQDSDSTQMSDDVIGAIVLSAYAPDTQAVRTFIHATAGLRWSSATLTHEIHAYTSDWTTLVSLSIPDLCSDVKAWGANGFGALPASITAFVGKFMPAWVAPGYMPAGLTRYESSATKALAARCHQFEEQISEVETHAVAQYGEIMDALAIWP